MDQQAPERVPAGEFSWLNRPFGRTFDLIASEYGWLDDQILDLTLGRLREVRNLIWARKAEEQENQITLEEAKLRNLVGAIHAAAGNKKGAAAAAKIVLMDRTKVKTASKELPSTQGVMATFGVDREHGLIDPAEIEKRAAQIRTAQAEEPQVEWVLNREAIPVA